MEKARRLPERAPCFFHSLCRYFFSLNRRVCSWSTRTWSKSSVLTATDSSLLAELVWTTIEICPMPSVTWAMEDA